MVLELHVWGPAFGLPSIEPMCIAAVACLNLYVPRDQWVLVSDYDTACSPQGEFPLLVDGDHRIAGFANIVSFLRGHYSGVYDLDGELTTQEHTHQTAFASFLEATATPLLDLYLYVSSENFNTTTSAAYTAILPWFANYTLPPKRRDLARARTAHLGLSSLDVTEASDNAPSLGRGTSTSEYEAAKRAARIPTDGHPQTLHMGRGRGVGGLLSSPIYAARFRLDILSNELLQPLADQLGKEKYILGGERPSSLDFLAFGYLSLLRYAPVPQSWISETIPTKFPEIDGYIKNMREEALQNEEIKAVDVWAVATGKSTAMELNMQLPWVPRSSRATLPQVLEALHESTTPQALQRNPTVQHGHRNHSEGPTSSLPGPLAMNTLAAVTSTVAIGLTALAIHHRRSPREGPLIFWALRPLQPVFDGFGVESFLGALPR